MRSWRCIRKKWHGTKGPVLASQGIRAFERLR
jgi:hypothetical protein